jgi:ketopantoate reductase
VFTALANTRDNWNAMLQDLRRGDATEMPYLNAAVDRLARRHGLVAPVNATVARLITHMARRRTRVALPSEG